jgi:hypothetical protein
MARRRLLTRLQTALWGVTLIGLAAACRTSTSTAAGPKTETNVGEAQAGKPAAPSAQAIPQASPSPVAQAAHSTGAAPPHAWPADLPRLKPVIEKPFPEGATESQVCEAIENTQEKDLWVRFGHLVPMFRLGAIYLIDGAQPEAKRIEDFVWNKYIPGLFRPDLRICPGQGLLLYLSGMQETGDSYGRPWGRAHFAGELEKLGLKVRASFPAQQDERLSQYCRADAELCERLVKMDRTNEGKGLCVSAVSRSRLVSDARSERDLLDRCAQLPRATVACVEYAFKGTSRDECNARLRESLQ